MTAGSEQVITTPPTDVTTRSNGLVKPTGAALLAAFPPRPIASSWPATGVSRSAVLTKVLAAPFTLNNPASQQTRRLGVLAVLSWLQTHRGGSWQQRRQASGAEEQPDWRDLITAAAAGRSRAGTATETQLPHLSPGLLVLICADVIRPGLGWLLRFAPARRGLATELARTRDTAAFAALAELCAQGQVGLQAGQQALTRVAAILAAKGGPVAAVRVGDCVELLQITGGMRATSEAHAHSPLFYQLLRNHGVLGEDAPATIEMFSGPGQPTCEQLIDRYRITCRPVRDVLVDYLRERQPSVDFSTLQRFAYLLGKLFWADLQAHHPGIDSLKLPREVAAAWKQRVMTRTRATTSPAGERVRLTGVRLDGRSVLSAVRAFYLDIAEWADDDPARWGPWAVRCPVSASDVSHKKDRSRRKSRMDQRTRERLPVLPALASWVQAERTRTAELLATAERSEPGDLFTATGETLRRPVMKTETTGRIWAEHPDGRRRNLTFEEHRGFWTWAMVEVLRHTGIRIEELTELSHHSLIQYRLPDTSELIPLLQITPSKTDAERLLVISSELADVLSTIVARIRRGQTHVPLVVSYDKNERVYNSPMPLLFQWRRRLEDRAVTETSLRSYLDHALTELGIKDSGGQTMRYTFHDFRRLFITDAILHGMPPHIAQLVAGHRDINTTMGYKAVYPEEVINGHRAFIARRRALRPREEYRTPTDEEWAEFIGHFEHRKVSVGDCGRSYDTPCIHEHSCLRCPLLRPDPTARPRLVQIRDNLIARIAEAESHRWLGEAEGLKVSLAGARAKLTQMDQITDRRDQTVQLGVPTFTDAAARSSTNSTWRRHHP